MPDNMFPAFPTVYTPEDSKRLKDLEDQKKAIAKLYPETKGFEAVFAEKPSLEQDARKLFATMPVVSNIAKAVAPADWGLQFGFTPEQQRLYSDQIEAEYSGLLRKQSVTGVIDHIKKDMTLAAIAGKPFSDIGNLDNYFPELKQFTPEEKKYVGDFALRLAAGSREDIISGKTTGEVPKVSSGEVFEWLGQNPQIDPRFILSTVAFSKDSEEISQALQYAYPPKVDPEDAMRKKLAGMQWELDTRKLKYGIEQKTDNATAIQKVHEKIAADGTSFALVDDATGNMIPGMLRPDNYITVNGVPNAYYDKTSGKVVPISTKGIAIMSQEAEDQANKDIVSGLGLLVEQFYNQTVPGLEYSLQSALDYMFFTKPVIEMNKPAWQKGLEAGIPPLSFITDAISGAGKLAEGKKPVTKPAEKVWDFEGQKEMYESTKAYLSEQQANRKLIHDKWVAEHPEFTPKQKYAEADWSNLGELAADPGFWGYSMGTLAGSMIPSLIATIGVTAATGGNIALGAVAGAAVMHPMNVQSNYDDLKASGASDEDAAVLSSQVGVLQGMLEYIPNLIGLKLIKPVIGQVFKKNITGAVLQQFNLFKVTGLTAADYLSEVGTEGAQQVLQNAAVKTVDETRDIMYQVPQTIITTAFGMLPMSILGGASNYVATKRNLPKSTQNKIDTDTKKYMDAGLPKNIAETRAVLNHLDTDQGRAEFDQANIKRIKEIPATYEMPGKQENLKRELKQIEKDIPINDRRIETAQKKIVKMKETNDPELPKHEKLLEDLLSHRKTLEVLKTESTKSYNNMVRLGRIQPEVTKGTEALPSEAQRASKDVRGYWDINLEKNPLRVGNKDTDAGAFLATKLENVGDLLREYYGNGDRSYLSEKFRRLSNELDSIDWSAKLSDKETQRLAKTKELLRELPDNPFSKLLNAIVDRNPTAISSELVKIDPLVKARKPFTPLASKVEGGVKTPEPSATKALPVEDILDAVYRIEKDSKMKPALDAWAKYCAEMEIYNRKEREELYWSEIERSEGKEPTISKNIKPTEVPSPILKVIERFGTDVNDISFHADITPELRESIKNTILTLPIKAIVSIRSIGIDPNIFPAAAVYRMDDQSITFRNVGFAASRYTLVHEISHNIIQEFRLGGGNYLAFAIKLGAAIDVTEEPLLLLIGKDSEGKTLGITKAGWNVADNQMTTEDKRVFMENQGRILEAYINDPNDLQRNAPSIYEVYREYFPKKSTTENMSISELEGLYGSPAPAPVNPDKIPRKRSIEDELQRANAALNTQSDYAAFIKLTPKVRAIFANGMTKFNDLHSRYGTANTVTQKVIEGEFAALAKDTGIPKSELLSRTWAYLTRIQQSLVSVAYVPDNSIKMPSHAFLSMEEAMITYQGEVPLPFLPVYRRTQLSTSSANVHRTRILKEMEADPYISPLLNDDIALKRVEDFIVSKDPLSGVPYPVGITANEQYFAQWLENRWKAWETKVRYLRIEAITSNTIENFKEEFPDAVKDGLEHELIIAIRLKEWGLATQDYNPLWNACKTWTWGVKSTGYTPTLIAHPSLKVIRRSLGATRGRGRLMSRDSVTFKASDKNIVQRYLTYEEQMTILWDLAPDLNYLDDMWTLAADKFENTGTLENEMKLWVATLQGIPPYFSTPTKALLQVRRVAMSAYFLNPRLALRNAPQGLILGLDRSESLRLIVQPVRPYLKQIGRVYFDEHVCELGGLKLDFLYQDQVLPPVLSTLVELSDKLSLFGKSEYYPKMLTFFGQLNKADRAMQELLSYTQNRQTNPPTRDEFKKAISKYLIDSGAIHLKDTEIAYLLANFVAQANTPIDFVSEGIRDIKGSDMASLYIAQRSTDQVHFNYNLPEKAGVELGADGRLIWNLMVYPRSYAQRLYYDAKLALDLKESLEAFANGLQKMVGTETDPVKDIDYARNRAAWKDLLLLAGCSMFYGWLYQNFSGEEENPYDMIANVFGWTVGGVFMSTNTAVFDLVGSLVAILNPGTPKNIKDIEASSMPTKLRKVTGMIPSFMGLVSIVDALLGVEGVDKYGIRLVRSLLDKEYTPEKLEKIERDAFDVFKKVIFQIKTKTPDSFMKDRKKLQEAKGMLGSLDAKGAVYTLKQYGGLIESTIGSTDSKERMSPQSIQDLLPGYNIAAFYSTYQKDTIEYEKIPDADTKGKENWRKTHLEAEAMMLFWGKFETSIFKSSPVQYKQVQDLVKLWANKFGIPDSGMPKADWNTTPPVR
jgi:hypothetical protein